MIELRWYSSDNKPRTLQYRQKIDTTVRAGMWSNMKIIETANYQWTDWSDVPEVHADPVYSSPHTPPSNQCPRCGIEFAGPMGYVCTTADCPTGLGGSMC